MDNFDGPAASPATGALGAGEEGFRVGCPSLHLIVQPQGRAGQYCTNTTRYGCSTLEVWPLCISGRQSRDLRRQDMVLSQDA